MLRIVRDDFGSVGKGLIEEKGIRQFMVYEELDPVALAGPKCLSGLE